MHVIHATRGEICRTYSITDKGNEEGVVGGASCPLFQTQHSFIAQQIGIFLFQSCWGECSVPVNDDMVFGSFCSNPFVEVHHPLVGMIHEVNLHSSDTPVSIGLEDSVEVVVHRQPRKPKHNLHAFGIAVFNQLRQTQFIIAVEGVGSTLSPSLVEQNVFNAIFCCKVCKVAIGIVVTTSLEIYVRPIGCGSVPPFPRELSGLNPAGIGQYASAC